jgi:hypothetical protein
MVPVPITVPEALVMVNVVFGSPVPVRVGVASAVVDPFAGRAIEGADGAVESSVTVTDIGALSPYGATV